MKHTWKRLLSAILTVVMLLSVTAFAPLSVGAADEPGKGDTPLRVLAIGNSYSQNSMEYLYKIFAAEGYDNVILGYLYHASCSLAMHVEYLTNNSPEYTYYKNTENSWVPTKNATLLDGLTDEPWDIITMQQASGYSYLASSYNEDLDTLVNYVTEHKTNPDAKYYWHMTWAWHGDRSSLPNKNQYYMYERITNAVKTKILTRDDFVAVIPAGTAVQNARTSFMGDAFTVDDMVHLNGAGKLASSYTWFCTLTGRDHLDEMKLTKTSEARTTAEAAAILEAVNNALATPYAVTPSASHVTTSPCTGDHTGWIALTSEADFDNYEIFTYNKNEDGTPKDTMRWPKDANAKYYLTADITMTTPRCIFIYGNSAKNSGECTLCLNGHTLTAGRALSDTTYSGFVYVTGTSATYPRTFNLCDCAGGGKLIGSPTSDDPPANKRAVVGINTYGTFNMYGGSICDSWTAVSGYGGVVRIGGGDTTASCTFNMYGGSITNNKTGSGTSGARAVAVLGHGAFNMYGGTIDCSADTTYGSAALRMTSKAAADAKINLYGGTIIDPRGVFGGDATTDPVSTICGGTITGPVVAGTVKYGVTVNGTQPTAAAATPGAYVGTGYSYDAATATLTLTDPAAITTLAWNNAFDMPTAPDFTVKLGANWTTDLLSYIPAHKSLTIDLNGHDLIAADGIKLAGALTMTDSAAAHGAVYGGVKVLTDGTLNDPLGLVSAGYPVYVNGEQLDVLTASGDGYSYDPATATLTLSDPTKITALTWDDTVELTVKPGADWTTDLFATIAAGKTLTLDLNGYTVTAGEMTIFGTLNVTGAPGTLSATVTVLGVGALNDPDHLVSGAVSVTYPVRVNGATLTSTTGAGYIYTPATATLTVTDPTQITAIEWDADIAFTLKLGADWDTSSGYDPLAGLSGKALTLDLAGHTIGKPGYSAVDGESAPAPVQNDLSLGDGSVLTIKDSTATTVDGVAGISDGAVTGYSVTISGTAKLNLQSGTIADGYKSATGATDGGGGVRIEGGVFTMDGGRLTACYAKNGGAINVRAGTFTMNNGRIDHNSSGRFGAICAGAGTTNLNGGLIDHNETVSSDSNARGGAVAAVGGTVKFGAVTFDNNKARVSGGAVYLFSPKTYTMNGTIFTNNECTAGPGGAIHVLSGQKVTLNATNVTFTGNKTTGSSKYGGACDFEGATVTLTDCTFTGNSATGDGGAIYQGAGTLTLNNTTISGNTSGNTGGGVYSKGTVTMNSGSVTGNSSKYGGGFYVFTGSTMTMNGGSVSGNSASNGSAEIYAGPAGATFTLNGGTIGVKGKHTNQFYFYAGDAYGSAGHVLNVYGGTLYSGINTQGNLGATINVYGGRLYGIDLLNATMAATTVKVYGGLFTNPGYLPTVYGAEGYEIGHSADADFPYVVAPKASFEFALNAAETDVEITMSSAEAAWTYYNGSETPAVLTPATATLKLGERTIPALAVTTEGEQYVVTAPVTTADFGTQYELTVFDASGAPIRVFMGHLTGSAAVTTAGDVNGDGTVNVKDVVTLQRHIAGGYGITLTTAQGDIDNSGSITIADVVTLMRYLVGGYGVTLEGGSGVSDDPSLDGEFNVFLMGNSLVYYWPDELYQMMEAAGYENVHIYNMYYSGSTNALHWNWYVDGESNYGFYCNDANGRTTIKKDGTASLEYCANYKNWDVIGFVGSVGDTYTYKNNDLSGLASYRRIIAAHFPLVFQYLKERFPNADYYWQRSWLKDHDNDTTPYQSGDDRFWHADHENFCKLTKNESTLEASNVSYTTLAQELNEQFGLIAIPTGDAWLAAHRDPEIYVENEKCLNMRIVNGEIVDDPAHDGDVGGGQMLMACLWYEMLTHTSCLDNTFRPTYTLGGVDHSLTDAQISVLKNASHNAVANYYGADFYK